LLGSHLNSDADLSAGSETTGFSVTLVVPMRNEAASIEALLLSIRAQSYLPEEVILVDGGSVDATVQIARQLTTGDKRFHIISVDNATPGRGRNIGILAARCPWIALTDAGIRLSSTWLEELVAARSLGTQICNSVVYGNYEPVTDSWFTRCAALTYVAPRQLRPGGVMRGPSVASVLLRRDVWFSVGGFPDLRAAEDLIFMESIERSGHRIGWAPRATVYWQLQATLSRTFRKFALYSKHNVWAGRQSDWHYGTARMYLAASLVILLSIVHAYWWLAVLTLAAALRVARCIWQRRSDVPCVQLLSLSTVVGVAIVLLVIDIATFVGWVRAIRNGNQCVR